MTGMREALIDVRDNGLIYWEPITARGRTQKALMLARIDAALAQPEAQSICVEAAQVDTRSIDEASKRLEVQSDAEPVAWRWRYKGPWPWTFIDDRFSVQRLASHNEIEVEPLYTAPPRPDASAGLIEVAEMAEEYASKYCYDSQAEQGLLRNFAQFLRSRAADRSRKP